MTIDDAAGSRPLIVGLGEALIDRLPSGDAIGGAPLNVAVHAAQLGNAAAVVSRVGDDERGRRITGYLRERGVDTEAVQVDPDRPTGTVDVSLDDDGDPTYTIHADVAWDRVACDDTARDVVADAAAVCFGTLAQRTQASRDQIAAILDAAGPAEKLFDANLRQDYFDRDVIDASLQRATAAKCNAHELGTLAGLLGLSGSTEATVLQLMQRYGLSWVAITRGAEGVAVFTGEGEATGPRVSVDTSGGDAVGAGDSVSAALLHGSLRGWPWERTLGLANRVGAYVASQRGACPSLPSGLIES